MKTSFVQSKISKKIACADFRYDGLRESEVFDCDDWEDENTEQFGCLQIPKKTSVAAREAISKLLRNGVILCCPDNDDEQRVAMELLLIGFYWGMNIFVDVRNSYSFMLVHDHDNIFSTLTK